MFVTVLSRVADFDTTVYGKSTFSDVKADAWYSSAVEWAYDLGIISGIGNNEFKPDDPITREQICAILTKFAATKSFTLPIDNVSQTFTDDAAISAWASAAVYNCQRAGIVSGDTAGNFNPAQGAKRSEAAVMLVRFNSIIGG